MMIKTRRAVSSRLTTERTRPALLSHHTRARTSRRIRVRSCIILLYAAALTFVGCRKEATPPPAQQAGTTTASATTAEPPKDLSGENEKINVKLSVEKKVAWQCKVGSTLDTEGLVSEEKNELTAKEVVHLSMFLREAPPKLAVSAVAYDE